MLKKLFFGTLLLVLLAAITVSQISRSVKAEAKSPDAAYHYMMDPYGEYTSCDLSETRVKFKLLGPMHEEYLEGTIAKCSSTYPTFSKDGRFEFRTIQGDIVCQNTYNKGYNTIHFTCDPVGKGFLGRQSYVVWLYSSDLPNEPKKTEGHIDAWPVYLGAMDLAIYDILVTNTTTGETLSSGDSVAEGSRIRYEVQHVNLGDNDITTDFDVEYFDNGVSFDTDVETSTVDGGGNDIESESTYFTPSLGQHSLTVELDSSDDIAESDETNNQSEAFILNVVEDLPDPDLYSSRLFIEDNLLKLEFCGTNVDTVYVGSKRVGKDFGIHSVSVNFGDTLTCHTEQDLADGAVLQGATYYTGVALKEADVYNVCSSSHGLCDSITTALPGHLVPWPGGDKRRVTTYPNANHFAYDFSIGIQGSLIVVASQKGIVRDVIVHNTKHCYHDSCKPYGNYITVDHPDGTRTLYLHLKKDGALVVKGQHVNRGDPIGILGYSGFMNGLHLHYKKFKIITGEAIHPAFADADVVSHNPDGKPECCHYYISDNYETLAHALNIADANIAPIGWVRHLATSDGIRLNIFAYDYEDPSAVQIRLSETESGLETASWQSNITQTNWTAQDAWMQILDGEGMISAVYSSTLDSNVYQPVQASFQMSSTACTGEPVWFENQTDCSQCSWYWDLGDGRSSTKLNPESDDIYMNVSYGEPGQYDVTLTATGLQNYSSEVKTLQVNRSPNPGFMIARNGDTVNVQAEDESASSWQWDWGDGTTASGLTASHKYSSTAHLEEALITLNVTGSNGCSSRNYQMAGLVSEQFNLYLPLVKKSN